MSIKETIKKALKGKGTVRNHSSKILLVIESTANHPHGPPIIHRLGPKRKSPNTIDADGFKRADGKSIKGHSSWWKILDYTTVDIFDHGDNLTVKAIYMRPVEDNHFGKADDDYNTKWGSEIKYISGVKKHRNGVINAYYIESVGWLPKTEAIKLFEQGEIDNVVIVRPKNKSPYLRSRPDEKKSNNFSKMDKS